MRRTSHLPPTECCILLLAQGCEIDNRLDVGVRWHKKLLEREAVKIFGIKYALIAENK